MGRTKLFGKRKFRANQHRKLPLEEAIQNDIVDENDENISASAKKIKMSIEDSSSCQSKNCIIVEIGLLSSLIQSFVKCKYCDSTDSVITEEVISSRRGLATNLLLSCMKCRNGASSMMSSSTNHMYDANIRLAYGMRCIGRGRNAAETLCGMMNLPPPPTKFSKLNNCILTSLREVSEVSMKSAVEETVSSSLTGRDICAAFDGTWQKRGHSSLNGVVAATSLDNGKILDVECLSKYCTVCPKNLSKQHKCNKNYEGSSGGMEAAGVLKIFQRSENTRHVRYTGYLGDGDSKGFDNVCASNVYGNDVSIMKLECIAHVQKRMGTRLRKLKAEYKGKKLSDGKTLSGKNRLTDSLIARIQSYYGLAIREHTCKPVKEMSKAVWAIYFHMLSTNDFPQHGLCPTHCDTWCGYNKAKLSGETFSHKYNIPESIMLVIKPVFKSLSCPKLLSKCTHGKTQNPNESFNNCIWERLPKTTFISLSVLEIGVRDAVLTFNDGVGSRQLVLQHLGLQPGHNMLEYVQQINQRRLTEANKAFKNASKEARMKKKQIQRALDAASKQDKSLYAAGQF